MFKNRPRTEQQNIDKAIYDKWYKCKDCNGVDSKSCGVCHGRGIGKFLYDVIKDDKSSITKDRHIKCLIDFCIYLKEYVRPDMNNIQDLDTFYRVKDDKESNTEYLTTCAGDFIRYLREEKQHGYKDQKGTGRGNQKAHCSAIIVAYEVQEIGGRVLLPKKKLYRAIAVEEEEDPPYGYDIGQIKLLILNASLTVYKVLIATLTSSGCRIGCIWDMAMNRKGEHNFLKLKDLKLITIDYLHNIDVPGSKETAFDYIQRINPDILDNLPVYLITFYRGAGRGIEYKTFIHSEATKLINQMFQERRDAGENDPNPEESLQEWMRRNPEAAVFRNRFRSREYQSTKFPSRTVREERRRKNCSIPEPIRIMAMRKYMMVLRDKLGDQVKFTRDDERHRIPLFHGYRHFHKVTLSHSNVNSDLISWLQGRKLEGSEEAYSTGAWPDYMRLVEYWKAVPSLTTDREKFLKQNIEEEKSKTAKERKGKEFAEAYTDVLSEKQKLHEEKTDREGREMRGDMNKMMAFIMDQQAFIDKMRRQLPEDTREKMPELPEAVKKKISSSVSLEQKSVIGIPTETEDDSGRSSDTQ